MLGKAGEDTLVDEGVLTLSQHGVVLFTGHEGADGVFTDKESRARFGRVVAGSLVVDAKALPAALSRAESDRDGPQICPAPSEEDITGRKERGLAFQEQITRLPRGLEVVLPDPDTGRPVRFDGCCIQNPNCVKDGDMLEAKGPGYAGLMSGPLQWQEWFTKLQDVQEQMKRQDRTAAADGRFVEWHFAEKGPYDYFTKYKMMKNLGTLGYFSRRR